MIVRFLQMVFVVAITVALSGCPLAILQARPALKATCDAKCFESCDSTRPPLPSWTTRKADELHFILTHDVPNRDAISDGDLKLCDTRRLLCATCINLAPK